MRYYMIIGLLICFGIASTAIAQSPETAEMPSFKSGDSWTYTRSSKYSRKRTGKEVITITSVSDTGYETSVKVLEGDADGYEGKNTNEMNAIIGRGGRKFDPYVPYFSFPMMPGKTWEGSWKYTKIKRRTFYFKGTMKSRVEGWENIKTPAGEFKTLKITFKAKIINQFGRGPETTGTRWYCPAIRHIVRSEIKDKGGMMREEVKELVSYKLAP